MIRVSRVRTDSIAEALGIVPGTELLSVNGRALDDFLDWEFLTADDALLIEFDQPTRFEVHPNESVTATVSSGSSRPCCSESSRTAAPVPPAIPSTAMPRASRRRRGRSGHGCARRPPKGRQEAGVRRGRVEEPRLERSACDHCRRRIAVGEQHRNYDERKRALHDARTSFSGNELVEPATAELKRIRVREKPLRYRRGQLSHA